MIAVFRFCLSSFVKKIVSNFDLVSFIFLFITYSRSFCATKKAQQLGCCFSGEVHWPQALFALIVVAVAGHNILLIGVIPQYHIQPLARATPSEM